MNNEAPLSQGQRLDALADRLDTDGPIYASVSGGGHTPRLELSDAGAFVLTIENNDVGGGESVAVTDDFALEWLGQFGEAAP